MKPARLTLSLLAGVLLACNQPPSRELAAAEGAIAEARQEGADVFAAERFREAEAALQAARQKVEQKDYRGALSSALDAAERARAAGASVPSAKVLLKSAAETAQAEAQAALDEVAAIKEEAKKARVPDGAFEAVAPRVAETEAALAAVTERLAEADLIGAQKATADLKARTAGLAADYRAALEKWQEEHPRGRRPARRR
jgi:hypothetical protein